MSIVCIGQAAYDITIQMQEPIVDNRKYRISKEFRCGGGPALNAACICAYWGAEVQLVSRIGSDQYGDELRKILERYHVNTAGLIDDLDVKTPYSYIFVNTKTGNRTIFNHSEKIKNVSYSGDNLQPDVILTDGHEEKISIEMIKKFPHAKTVIDAGSYRESTLNVARYVDYLICSEDFVRQYLQKEINLNDQDALQQIFQEIQAINHKTVVITLGERGLLYEENGVVKRLEAYSVNAVDTTGAGDIFHGAFAYGVYRDMSLLENLKQSSKASAISVQTLGGQTSIPSFDIVQQWRR